MTMIFMVDGIEGIIHMAHAYTDDETFYYVDGILVMPKNLLTNPVFLEFDVPATFEYWKYMIVNGQLVAKPIILTPAEKEAQRELLRDEIRSLELPIQLTRDMREYTALLLSRETNMNTATEAFKTKLDTTEAAIQVLRDKIAAIV